jgi:integral membrane protein
MTTSSPADAATRPGRVGGALLRYRIMAYTTGVLLILLVFVALPLKWWAHERGPVAVIGTAHGFLFMVYLVTALDLGVRMRWALLRLSSIMIAGTIPFLSFVAERSVSREVRATA